MYRSKGANPEKLKIKTYQTELSKKTYLEQKKKKKITHALPPEGTEKETQIKS